MKRNVLDLSILLDYTHDIVQSADPNGLLLYANHAWYKTLGYSPGEAQGMSVLEVIHPESRAHCRRIIEEIPHLRQLHDEKITLLSKKGDKIYTSATIICKYDDEGNHAGTQAIFNNLTKERIAESSAKQSEFRYKMLVESADDLIYSSAADGSMVYMNQLGEELLGYPMDEILGSHFTKFIREDYREQVERFYEHQFQEKLPSTYLEFPITHKDGTQKWVGQNVRTILDQENADWIEGYIGVVRDITERRKMETELMEDKKLLEDHVWNRTERLERANAKLIEEVSRRQMYEQRLLKTKMEYEQLFQNAHDAIIVFRADDEMVLEANRKACEMYGFTRNEFIGMSLEKITLNIPAGKKLIRKTQEAKFYQFETTQLDKSGNQLILEVNATAINYRDQESILTINRDVTLSRELNRQLEAERKQKLNALIDGQEIERKRIAQELHDGIGQMLTSLIQLMRNMERQGKLSAEQEEVLKESEELTNGIIDETRRIAKNLMPSVLVDFGLESAFKSMIAVINRGENKVHFKSSGKITRLERKIEIGLYRIVQESISNALRHSRADKIELTTISGEKNLSIQVIDNGVGFKLDQDRSFRGNGLSNMTERAQLIGAGFEIGSSEEGTRIKINYDINE